jgi:hypothetical protein
MKQASGTLTFRSLLTFCVCTGVLVMVDARVGAVEPLVGETEVDRQRNAALLSEYDYRKYPVAITGYNGQDLQRVGFFRWQHAIRTRVGSRGSYKAGMTQLPGGKLVLAACCDNHEKDSAKRAFLIDVYESADEGLTWQKIGRSPLFGKEPSLASLPDGSLVLSVQEFGPGATRETLPISRSTDGGRTWETFNLEGGAYPRNLIVEPDGTLLMVRGGDSGAVRERLYSHLELGRSQDGGKTWQFSEGIIDWKPQHYGEVGSIRLRDGRLLAVLRTRIPGAPVQDSHGFGVMMITQSTDDGRHWSKPEIMTSAAEVHVYLTELTDGRILATYSSYHLPFGVFAIVSSDGGKTWDRGNPIQLALSARNHVGWPVTLELAGGDLITAYALTAYLQQPPDLTVTEVVRWQLP